MQFVDLEILTADQLDALAELTFTSARSHSPTWLCSVEASRDELEAARRKYTRVVLDDGFPVAWIAAAHAWGRIWEIHPLIVSVAARRRGYGRALVGEAEAHARLAGALVMTLSTSDAIAATTLANVDLFDEPLRRLADVRTTKPHALDFWQRVGYQVVGVMPDAEGPGQPSINLAKRLR